MRRENPCAAPEEINRVLRVAGVGLTEAAPVPLGRIAQAHVAMVCGDRPRDEEGGDGEADQQHQRTSLRSKWYGRNNLSPKHMSW
jgi:hypothetical protein